MRPCRVLYTTDRRQTAPATTRLHSTALLAGPHMVGEGILKAAQGHSTPPNVPV
jgi:hypothetical protein